MKNACSLLILGFVLGFSACNTSVKSPPNEQGFSPNGRALYEFEKVKDPATNAIPVGIERRALTFAKSLPSDAYSRNSTQEYTLIGPYNVGGRTRAGGVDIRNNQILLAGGVSGGMWRSVNRGKSWTKVTSPDEHHAVSCLVQDTRTGKENTWYYGSGEGIGNSASKSFSALYTGNGIYKSTDNGLTWQVLQSTVSNDPQSVADWDYVWRVAIDPSNLTQDELYAAIRNNIMKSTDGGTTWKSVLSSQSASFADVACSPSGVVYATFSFDGAADGVYRSVDGETFVRIDQGFPSSTDRIVIGIDPNNENNVYFLASTPGAGMITQTFSGGTDANSLFQYTYLSSDGSGNGGNWANLSQNIPSGLGTLGDFNSQGSYNLLVAVQPGNSNHVIIGGTNLYISTDGFSSPNNTNIIGGYDHNTSIPFFDVYLNHHPDQHWVAFDPQNSNAVFSFNDGGVQVTDNVLAPTVEWESLNNGYVTTQFYTNAVIKGASNEFKIIGGLQDNGTYLTYSNKSDSAWWMPETGDGSFCAIADNGIDYYTSRQNGRIGKLKIDANGKVTHITRIDPAGGGGYLFINPFVLDPMDNNILYVAGGNSVWRNDSLSQLSFDSTWQPISQGWTQFSHRTTGTITAMAVSQSPAHTMYIGTNGRRIYRADSVHTGNPQFREVTKNIASGGYTSDIAIDPRDANKAIVVYSNYNVYSLWYTQNGGESWRKIAGNLEADLPPDVPPTLDGLGDGPSIRCAEIIPVAGGKTVYLVGTSVGLFGTDTLLGDSTTWTLQGANTIGNVVVDAIDTRINDGFTAIATHGNGMYYTYISNPYAITKVENRSKLNVSVKAYPNPCSISLNIEIKDLNQGEPFQIINSAGKLFYEGKLSENQQLNVAWWPAGQYYICTFIESKRVVTPFIKQ